jgi:TonB family protein
LNRLERIHGDFLTRRVDLRGAVFGVLVLTSVACGGDGPIERPSPLAGAMTIEYPLSLWDQGVEGECLLKVRVNDLGLVDSVVVIDSSGYPAFDSAAIHGARDIRFRPARKDGRRIDVWAQVPVHFSRTPKP